MHEAEVGLTVIETQTELAKFRGARVNLIPVLKELGKPDHAHYEGGEGEPTDLAVRYTQLRAKAMTDLEIRQGVDKIYLPYFKDHGIEGEITGIASFTTSAWFILEPGESDWSPEGATSVLPKIDLAVPFVNPEGEIVGVTYLNFDKDNGQMFLAKPRTYISYKHGARSKDPRNLRLSAEGLRVIQTIQRAID